MSKEDMMNKISFALKDSILQMGFEVICSKLSRLEKENAELKEKISVLLSCKKCPENKGGWICVKEYENKCLSQKIVYIKELEKEKCKLLGIIRGKDKVIQELKKELNKVNEWHKVADGDLPKDARYVWTNVGAGYHDAFGRLQNVIAWCEPKFEE